MRGTWPAALPKDELAHPARKYAPPHGRLYLVCTGSTPVGCIALKALDDTRCEMKRLYVRPEYRGQGIARALVHQLMQEARVAGLPPDGTGYFPLPAGGHHSL